MRRQGAGEASTTSTRRGHKKSRRGCRNCKLRRVKCDETKPDCRRCISYGVSCNYNANAADLQPSFNGMATMEEEAQPIDQSLVSRLRAGIKAEPPRLFHVPPIISDGYSSLEMDVQSFERLRRFQLRTVLTMGGPDAAAIFQTYAIQMSCSSPYVMHLVQALTSMHDRYLLAQGNQPQVAVEAYHISRAAALFNRKLSTPLSPADRDAVWAASCLIGWVAFSCMEGSEASEVWPLAPPKPSDLEWLRMNDGKTMLWSVTDPTRPDSIFSVLANDFASVLHTTEIPDTATDVPPAFTRLYGLDDPAADAGPYAVAVRSLASLLSLECDRSNVVVFLLFQSYFKAELRELLMQKDARALLLLAYWYAKICRAVWWVERRATLECLAICIYLERYHGDDAELQELLHYPKMRCGMSVEDGL